MLDSPFPAPQLPELVAVCLGTLLTMPIPERGFVLDPVIPTQGLVMLYAPRGIGKTFVALSIAIAVASGGRVFNWLATASRKVLYIDGEMPAISMKERLESLATGMAVPPCALENLVLITPDLQPCPMPDLSTEFGQATIEPFLAGVDVVVLDNLATLCRTGKENESHSWVSMQAWLLDLRRRGLAVILVHHVASQAISAARQRVKTSWTR